MLSSHSSLTDSNWKNDSYRYLDARLDPIHWTDVPSSDEEAKEYFTFVRDMGPTFHPIYLQVKRAGEVKYQLLPVEYDEKEDVWDEL
jgi:hypothetical protein